MNCSRFPSFARSLSFYLMSSFFQRWKARWGVEHNWQFALIFLVFALAGSSLAFLFKPYVMLPALNAMGIERGTWAYYALYIPFGFICYQIFLLTYAVIFFQWKFFWAFEKKMLRRFGFFRGEKKSEQPS